MMEADASFTEVDLKQEKFEDVEEEGKNYSCDLCDKEMVHKMALVLIEGLSTACVDNTTGDIFKSPGTVAADIRKEMLDYLNERSESFVAETFFSEEGPVEGTPDQPSDIISDIIEDFTTLKRNILSRVSGWLLSDMREDKIDDFIQEMELNSFWLLDRRETIAQTLLKNVDYKNEFHCNMKFKSEEEVEQHRPCCGFRTMLCANEGCCATFSAAQLEQHDSICPFKMLPCEQKCPEILMRREMDRHCITVCPMKLINCPFYSVGCQATVPSCNIKEHCLNDVRSHLLYALQYLHKGASAEDLAPRADQIEQESIDRLKGMQSVRFFTNTVKELDSRLGPFEIVKTHVDNDGDTKKLNADEEPPSEDKSKLDSEETPNGKKLDSDRPTTGDEKKSDPEQPSPKSPKTDEVSIETSPKSGTEHNIEENIKSPKFGLVQAEEGMKLVAENEKRSDSEQLEAEEEAKLDSEQPVTEEEAKLDSLQPVTEKEAKLDSEPSATEEEVKLDSEQPATEEEAKLDSQQPATEEEANLDSEQSTTEEEVKLDSEQPATKDESESDPEQPSPKGPETDELKAEESSKSDNDRCTVESKKESEHELPPAEEVKKSDAEQPATVDMSEIRL